MALDLPIRPRRNRRSPALRAFARETDLTVDRLVQPCFLHSGMADEEISSLPGCRRWSLSGLVAEAESLQNLGVNAIVLFPSIDSSLKRPQAEEAFNSDGLVPMAIRALKAAHPNLIVITDVALDPYSSDGHDGLVAPDGRILNDETVEVLVKQAICHAEAGADIIAPSDMMDGRIGAIRAALDDANFQEVNILSYCAKYASSFYGPFRGALDSAPKAGDKKSYQMDPANANEALREADLDLAEGADFLMVKPAGPYLDVIRDLHLTFPMIPIAAYQVSGEYLMIKSAAASGWLDEKATVLESLIGIRRAGAQMILTYFAKDVAQWLE